MDTLTILTILFLLIVGTIIALLISYMIVPQGFRTYNYQIKVPKVYKRRSRRK